MHAIFLTLLSLKVGRAARPGPRCDAVRPAPLLQPQHRRGRACVDRPALCPQVENVLPMPWWAVLTPEFVVHLVQVPLFVEVLARRVRDAARSMQLACSGGGKGEGMLPQETAHGALCPPCTPAPTTLALRMPAPRSLQEAQVSQQLGPPPGPRASAGLVVQYATMRRTRLRTLCVDYGCNVAESLAVLAVKLLLLRELEAGRVEAGMTCWRFIFLPLWWVGRRECRRGVRSHSGHAHECLQSTNGHCATGDETHALVPLPCPRLLWPLTSVASWFKAPAERMLGSMADLACLTAVFVALKLDGVVGYSWKVRAWRGSGAQSGVVTVKAQRE